MFCLFVGITEMYVVYHLSVSRIRFYSTRSEYVKVLILDCYAREIYLKYNSVRKFWPNPINDGE